MIKTESPSKEKRPRVLVIDDDPDVLDHICDTLDKQFDVVTSESAESALDILKKASFDVVLTDFRMRGSNGIRLAQQINGFNPEIPVVVMSGFGSEELALQALRANVFDFVDKPFDDHLVVSVLDRALLNRKQQDERRELLRNVHEKEIRLKLAREQNQELQDALLELNNKKNQLIQKEKLASLGVMAAGIAHELNNPLAIIVGMAHLVDQDLAPDSKAKKKLSRILESGERMRKIIDQMRHHGGAAKEDEWGKIDIGESVRSAFILLNERLNQNSIKININEGAGKVDVFGHAIKIQTVLQNLILNSLDAFEMRRPIKGGDGEITVDIRYGDSEVQLEYFDTAGGIEKTALNKVFDPFFSTKATGVGTGLGLYICQKIVREHKGDIYVVNKSEGALFTITFPTVSSDEKVNDIREIKQRVFDAGTKPKVLIVEDEEDLVHYFLEILGSSCEIRAFTDSREAILDLDQHDYDLILADFGLPHVSGIEVLKKAVLRNPETVVMLVTGHSENEADVNIAYSHGASEIITKPLGQPSDLLNVLSKYFLVLSGKHDDNISAD